MPDISKLLKALENPPPGGNGGSRDRSRSRSPERRGIVPAETDAQRERSAYTAARYSFEFVIGDFDIYRVKMQKKEQLEMQARAGFNDSSVEVFDPFDFLNGADANRLRALQTQIADDHTRIAAWVDGAETPDEILGMNLVLVDWEYGIYEALR
jgi:hypothetical protein